MFKVGDRVRCTSVCDGASATVGKVYTVFEPCGGPLVSVMGDRGFRTSMFYTRFELVSSNEPFNVSTATDQEVADEYRRVSKQYLDLFKVLKERGYKQEFKNGNVLFTRTETQTFTI